jgi:hypothetical protein
MKNKKIIFYILLSLLCVVGTAHAMIIPPGHPAPTISGTPGTSTDGTLIVITFSKAMNLPYTPGEFSVDNGSADSVIAAYVESNTAIIDLEVETPIQQGQTVTVSYSGSDVTSTDGGTLASFSGQTVTNDSTVTPPPLTSDTLKPCNENRNLCGTSMTDSCTWDYTTSTCYNPATTNCSASTRAACESLPRFGCEWYGGTCINPYALDRCSWASGYLPVNWSPCQSGAYGAPTCYVSSDHTTCLSYSYDLANTPTETEVVITHPSINATITSDSDNLTGNWWNINPNAWGFVHFSFINETSQENSQEYSLPITDNNGTFSIPLSSFGITENGTWDLKVQAENSATLFMDLSPSPTYTLVFNIAGNTTPYNFTDWNTWYTQNAAGGYSTPSDFANSIVGFIQPIFKNAGEFANAGMAYFNSTNFYGKGNQLGLVFPTTQAYLNKINVFFGGFPLVPFFEMATFVMLGIFIVRTIFKFIPFFG